MPKSGRDCYDWSGELAIQYRISPHHVADERAGDAGQLLIGLTAMGSSAAAGIVPESLACNVSGATVFLPRKRTSRRRF
jgi:hypothetical protein